MTDYEIRAIKQMVKDGHISQEVVEGYFPELAESEDEKILKELIKQVVYITPNDNETDDEGNILPSYEERIDKYITCLEKQAQHTKFLKSIQKGDELIMNDYGVLVNRSQLKRKAKKEEKQGEQKSVNNGEFSVMSCCANCPYYHEQKSADEVEPKFKVGDLIIHNIASFVYKVKTVGRHEYCVISLDGKKFEVSRSKEDSYHLWTIQDAKAGDVLFSKHGTESFEWIGIFKSYEKEKDVLHDVLHFYGYYNNRGNTFNKVNNEDFANYEDFIPATKEQRDLLFQKMHEAEYEWSQSDLKLIKIKDL